MNKLALPLLATLTVFTLGTQARANENSRRRPPAVVVWMYGPASGPRLTNASYNGDCSPGGLSVAMGNAVNSRLDDVDRFDLASTASLDSTAIRGHGRHPHTPEEAVEAGRELGVDYLIYGNVENASTDVDRNETETGKGKNKRRDVNYTGRTELRVHHVAVDVRTGQVWKESRDKDSRSFTSDCYPENSQFRSSFLKSVDNLAANWVRELVPDRAGRVLSKGDGVLVIDLGRRDGVGMDTDFTFTRPDVLRDKNGNPLEDRDGKTFPSNGQVMAAASSKHKPSPVYGRVVTLQDDYCVVKVGYKGSGGFLGLETKLKENEECFDAVRLDDDAVLIQRVGK